MHQLQHHIERSSALCCALSHRKAAEAAELEAVLAAVDRCPPHQQQMYYMPQLPVNRSRVVSIHRIQNWCGSGALASSQQATWHGHQMVPMLLILAMTRCVHPMTCAACLKLGSMCTTARYTVVSLTRIVTLTGPVTDDINLWWDVVHQAIVEQVCAAAAGGCRGSRSAVLSIP